MRMQCRETCHPEAPKQLFYLQGDAAANASKASVACSNRGATRVPGLGLAREGGREPVDSYAVPPPVGKQDSAAQKAESVTVSSTTCRPPDEVQDGGAGRG